MSERPRLLLVDDGETYADAITRFLPEFSLLDPKLTRQPRAPDGPAALAFLEGHHTQVDVVLLDMRFDIPEDRLLALPEAGNSSRKLKRFQGIAILRALRARFPELPVVLLTAEEDLALVDVDAELSAQSMTYLLGGQDLDALRIRLHTALEDRRKAHEEDGILWGRSPELGALRRRLSVLARGRLPVVLEGETGTGKSYLAERFIHTQSGRAGPFVVLDLATVPQELVAAHLFGAVRGAYTGSIADRKGVFELAHQGTLFIDEIQNIPLELQKQLLVVLQERRVRPLGASRELPVDVKVVAASNVSLQEAVHAGRFRADLFMRLSPATRVVLPPLRAHLDDLPFLARRLVAKAMSDPDVASLAARVSHHVGHTGPLALALRVGRETGAEPALELVLPKPAWDLMARYPWPGNLRELSMVMENLITFTLVAAVDAIEAGASLQSARLQVDAGLVGDLIGRHPEPARAEEPACYRINLAPRESLNAVATAVERQYLTELFQNTRGDFAAMAEQLLGDAQRARAVRLRFNQLGLKVRELKG